MAYIFLNDNSFWRRNRREDIFLLVISK